MEDYRTLISTCKSAAEITHCLKEIGDESMKAGIYKVMDDSLDTGLKKGIIGGVVATIGTGIVIKLGQKGYRLFSQKRKKDKEESLKRFKNAMKEWEANNMDSEIREPLQPMSNLSYTTGSASVSD